MSQTIDTPDNVSDVGQTSSEAEQPKKGMFENFTIFDAMLLISLVCIIAATLILVFEIRSFGDFPFGSPWRTDEFHVNPIVGN